MISKNPKIKTIPEYIKNAPEETQAKLKEVYKCIKKSAPGTNEGIKWSMPAFSYDKILVMFAVFKKHIGLYPTPSAIKKFSRDLLKYKTAKGSIQFSLDKPIPTKLIAKIVSFRVKEYKEQNKNWRS